MGDDTHAYAKVTAAFRSIVNCIDEKVEPLGLDAELHLSKAMDVINNVTLRSLKSISEHLENPTEPYHLVGGFIGMFGVSGLGLDATSPESVSRGKAYFENIVNYLEMMGANPKEFYKSGEAEALREFAERTTSTCGGLARQTYERGLREEAVAD
jgi:hypothetical protein